MKRAQLRTRLADCIEIILKKHKWTVPNCVRYCTASQRVSFNIRRDTLINFDDWQEAIHIALARKKEPVERLEKTVQTRLLPDTYNDDWKAPLLKIFRDQKVNENDPRYRALLESGTRASYRNKLSALRLRL